MNIGFLIKDVLDEEECDLFETLGEAFAYTNHDITLLTNESDRTFAKGYATGLNQHPITYISKGIFLRCDTVILYVTPDTIALIDSRNAWGTAHPILIPGLPGLREFTMACVAQTNVGPETGSTLSTEIPTISTATP